MSDSKHLFTLIALAVVQLGCATSSAQEQRSGDAANMPRVAPIPIEDMTEQQKQLLGIVDGEPLPGRAQSNLFRVLMHNPDLMAVYMPMGDKYSRAAEIPTKQRELVILRVAWLYQGKYEWTQHYGNALRAGWAPEDLERVKIGAEAPGWSAIDRTLLKAADQLVKNAFLEDDVWAALGEHYSVPEVMALITLVTHYHWVAMMTKSLEVEHSDEAPAFGQTSPSLIHEGSIAFVEGPATRSDRVVFFTDIPNNRIMRRETNGVIKLHRDQSNHANGLYFDSKDNLFIAETDGRIVRETRDGEITVLADSFGGAPFNAPNDLVLDRQGRIYFTDPAYRNRDNATQRNADGQIIDGVYRIDAPGRVTRIITDEVDFPNGILVSPGDDFLYVAENNNRANGPRQLVRFDLDASGNITPESKIVLFDWGTERGPDGMTIDEDGNIYVAAGVNHAVPHRTSDRYKAGIYIISPHGDLLNYIAVPMDQVTNVTFGGDDRKTLFVTAGHSLWSFKVDTPGYRPFLGE